MSRIQSCLIATLAQTVLAFTHDHVDLLNVLSSGVDSLTGVLELMLKRDALRLGPRESCFDSIDNLQYQISLLGTFISPPDKGL